jgi:Domain of unknown function (DUF4157)
LIGIPHEQLVSLQRAAGNRAVRQLLRAVAPPPARERRFSRAGDQQGSAEGPLRIVADNGPLAPGQIAQGQLLSAIEQAVCEVAERELSGTIYSAQGCPWIAHWIGYYRRRSPGEVQAAIAQYAPTTSGAARAEEVVTGICDRVSAGIAAWRANGTIPNVPMPAGVRPSGPGEPQPAGAARALMRSPADSTDPQGVQAELGPGRPLEPALASRMSSLLGADFSRARVHTDAAGGRVAHRHRAAALAVGHHVAFAPDAYEPGTPLGDALIAHELAHVAQHVETAGAPVVADADAERDALVAGIAAFAVGSRLGAVGELSRSLRRSVRSGLALRRCSGTKYPPSEGVYGRAPQTIRPGFDRNDTMPGEVPTITGADGTFRFSFDGDGDQVRELEADITATESWPSGAVKRYTVGLTQISSRQRRTAEFGLPEKAQGGGPALIALGGPTDGDRPTVVSVVDPIGSQELHIQPPVRSAAQAAYLLELTGHENGPNSPMKVEQRVNYVFPPEKDPLNEVFTTYDYTRAADQQGTQDFVRVGDIWTLDVTVGAYADRFRLTFRRLQEGLAMVVMGVAVLAESYAAGDDGRVVPLAGHTITFMLPGRLSPRILHPDPTRLVLDLDNDGRPDVVVEDRLTTRLDAVDPGTKDRDHELTIKPAGGGTTRFKYPVREGLILAGPPKPAERDLFGASDAAAASSLIAQEQVGTFDGAKGQLSGELIAVEQTLANLRRQAVDEKLISKELYDAWSKAESDFEALAAYTRTSNPPNELVDSATETSKKFYDLLASETKRGEEDVEGPDNNVTGSKNPFTGSQTSNARIKILGPSEHDTGDEWADQIKSRDWKAAVATYRTLVDGLDRWVAYVNREKFGKQNLPDVPDTQRAIVGERLSGLRTSLRELEGKNAVRVSAVLHVEEYFTHTGAIQDIALSMYYWREGDTWYVKDLTTPGDAPHWTVSARPGEMEPPRALFDKLDDNDHFPKGVVHWLLPSGTGGQTRTTGPSTIKRWATYIGVGAAAIGLGLVTFGEGTVAVVGAYVLAGSALIGAAQAGYDLYEKRAHGTLTLGTAVLDISQIVAAATGLGALRAGRILAGVRTAAAEGAAVEATSAFAFAQKAYLPLRVANVTSDVVTLAVMSDDLEKQVKRINEAPLDKDERKQALALVFTQFAFTGGLTALSVKGLAPEMVGAGQDITIVRYGNKEFAIPRGESLQGKAINERAAQLGEAPDAAARDELLKAIGKIGGKGGSALSDMEAMRLQPDTLGNVTLDPAGEVTAGGKGIGTLSELVEKAQQANSAAAAHGVKWRYTLEIEPAGSGGSKVRIVARSPSQPAPDATDVVRLFTNTTTGRAAKVAGTATKLRGLDNASRIEILPHGELRINGQIDIDIAALERLKPDELATLMKGTRELDAAGGSLDQLKAKDQPLADQLTKLASTGTYRLRFAAHRIQALKWAKQSLRLTEDLQTQLELLLGKADDESLTRFFDLANETPATSAARDPQSRNSFARYALEQEPKSLVDFVNRYQYARAEFIRRRKAAGGAKGEQGVLDQFNDKATRDAIAKLENAARIANATRVGAISIQPGATSAETVKALREQPGQLRFGDADALTYHVHKHHPELAPAEQAGQPGMQTNEVDAYLDAARKTLMEQPANAVKTAPTQDGMGVIYTFERARPGSTRTSKLLVLVRFDGQAIILTYIP